MAVHGNDTLNITTTRLHRTPVCRVTVSHGGITLPTDLDSEADVTAFVAGVHLGFTERDPELLRRAELPPNEEYDQIRREGIRIGLMVAGVAIPPVTHTEESPYALSCEDVGD